jgi:hypothetical protein
MPGIKEKLSALWLFAMLNYLYCDLVALMDADLLRQFLAGEVDGLQMSQGFLMAGSVLMEIPIAMTLLSRFAGHRLNRWANLVAGSVMTAAQAATLLLGTPTMYYLFFSIIEIVCTATIVRLAWTWRAPGVDHPTVTVRPAQATSPTAGPATR